MTPQGLLEGHAQATAQRAATSSGSYVVAVQDTTFFNYTTHPALQGMGYLQGHIKGVHQHNVLLLNQQGLPLGLLDQQYWSRHGAVDFEGTESLKWHRGLKATQERLADCGKPVVLVQDREADVFSFLAAERPEWLSLLVRVHWPRQMRVLDGGEPLGPTLSLSQAAEHLPVRGQRQVSIERQGKVLTLTLSLQASRVEVLGPGGTSRCLSLVLARQVGAVDAQDRDVFVAQEAAEWYLLSDLPVEDQADLERITDVYALRWRVERFHYSLKSGALQVERLQFDDLTTLLNALTFYSLVGVGLLSLTHQLRVEPDGAASTCYDEADLVVLAKVSQRPVATVRQATLALGRLVGFAPSRRQPLPGVKVLAQALERFFFLKQGFYLHDP